LQLPELEPGQPINDLRMDEIAAVGADLAALARSFCLIMLEEAATAQAGQASLPLKDIAEVVATALAKAEQEPQRLHRPSNLFDRALT
jgi:Fe-S oxidoreductase